MEDERAALIAYYIYNMNRGKNSPQKKFNSFLLHNFDEPQGKIQSSEEQLALIKRIHKKISNIT